MKLKIHYRPFNSGGKGGQHGNRTANAIEASVTLPDGRVLKTTSQTDRSQQVNRRIARAQLAAKVRDALEPEAERRETAGWGNVKRRVRTYHEPDDRVVDTSGFQRSYRQTVGRGEIGELVEERRLRKVVS